jgi:hypothetical protein
MGFFECGIGAMFPDAKIIHRALFGVFYEEDVYDKLSGHMPLAMRCFQWRIDAAVRRRKLIFVHVPRAAGTSIARALYGPGCTRHHSIRYFKTVAPRFFAQAASFAVVRDPFDRFASSYAFTRNGGTDACRMSDVFVRQTAHLKSVDDYLSFLEARDDFSLDFVMRPQSWFVCDLETGAPLVRRLFLYGQDDALLADYLKAQGVAELPWLNMSERMPLLLSARQKRRIEKVYARDFTLVEALRSRRAREDWTVERIAGIAAE